MRPLHGRDFSSGTSDVRFGADLRCNHFVIRDVFELAVITNFTRIIVVGDSRRV
jgi:hypothetical protein